MKQSLSIVLVLFAVLAMGCDNSPGANVIGEVGYGEMADNTYTNEYFGLTAKLPDDWHVMDREEIASMQQTGKEVMAGDNKALKNAMDAAEQNVLTLYAVYQHKPGAAVPFNTNMSVAAEKVGHVPGIDSAEDYHYHVKQTLEQGAIPYTFPHDNFTETIGNLEFTVMKPVAHIGQMKLTQEIYAARVKDYMIILVLSYGNDEQQKLLKDIIADMTFE